MGKTKRKARKTKAEAERRSQVYQFRLNPGEHRVLHERAESEQKTVADFIRERVFA